MKTPPKCLALLITICISQTSAPAAGILLDSFTEGGFSLSVFGNSYNRSSFHAELVNEREVSLNQIRVSSSILSTTEGTLSFTFSELRPNIKENNFSTLHYANNNNSAINLIGLNAAVFKITSLVGEGEVLVYGNTGPDRSTALLLTGTGSIVYPFSLANGYLGGSSNTTLGFKFIPRSLNFSVTMSEITLIPEPSGACLLVFGAAALINRRSRFTFIQPIQAN